MSGMHESPRYPVTRGEAVDPFYPLSPYISGKILIPEIADLMPPLCEIVTELRQPIMSGLYARVICDDISGRIPSGIVGGVIAHIDRVHGRPVTQTTFVKGLEILSDSDARKLTIDTQNLSGQKQKRALIVTESIYSGMHINSITSVLRQLDVPLDIITMARGKTIPSNLLEGDERLYPTINFLNIVPGIKGQESLTGLRYGDGGVQSISDTPPFRRRFGERFAMAKDDIERAIAELVELLNAA